MPVISSTVTSRLDWIDTAVDDTINLSKETLTNEQGEEYTVIKATSPNHPDLQPRYGADRTEAVQAMQRVLWEYRHSGYDLEKANSVK